MAGFGSLAPGMEGLSDEDIAAMSPETYASPLGKAIVGFPKAMLVDLPKAAITAAQNYTPGLRREDYTDIPADTTPDPNSPLGGVGINVPRVGWQPVDPLIGKSLEAATNVMGGTAFSAPAKAGEIALGAGPKGKRAAAATLAADAPATYPNWHAAVEGTIHEPAAAIPAEAAGDVAGGLGGPAGGGISLPEAHLQAARWAGERAPLPGLPDRPQSVPGLGYIKPGPIGDIHGVAERYMADYRPERPYTPPTQYHPLDPEHSKAIAAAYEKMPHTPNDPATKNSYDALINETKDQYRAIKETGLKIEPIKPGMENPYPNPRMAAHDVAENNHLWFYPTEQGFGTVNKITDNPMLRDTGERLGDHKLLANDMFRVVHDYFGHLKEGHGFRAAGEDNAWRSHAAMYSDIARPAMTTETRGQNSWVNYGPHGEANRTADQAGTVYADQKNGLMPEWTMRDRGSPDPIVVYKGSPHTYDQENIAKVGTGEGNAAFGHGLYYAGHEPIGQWYRDQLAVRGDPMFHPQLGRFKDLADVKHVIAGHLSEARGDAGLLADEYAKLRQARIDSGDTDMATQNAIKDYQRRIDYLNHPKRKTGNMYEAALHVDPEHLLDWHSVLSGQSPYVQERLGPVMEASVAKQKEAIERHLENLRQGRSIGGSTALAPKGDRLLRDIMEKERLLSTLSAPDLTGHKVYERIGLQANPQAKTPTESYQAASRGLLKLQIPGLRYDAGSMSRHKDIAGKSSNYVMFHDRPTQLLRRYAIPGAIGAGGLGGFGSLIPSEEQQ